MGIAAVPFLLLSLLLFFGCDGEVSPTTPEGLSGQPLWTAPEQGSTPAAPGASSSKGPVQNFVAPLSGDQEAPPVETRASGVAKFQLKGGELSYHLDVSRMEEVTQAHIHCGARGVNGPIVVFLFGLVPEGVTANGRLASGTITAGDVIPRPDSAACPGGLASFEELLAQMRAGQTYTNVHTVPHPGGEIRGQIDRGNGVE